MLRAIPYTSLWFGFILWVIFGGSLGAGAGYWLYEDYLFAYESKPVTGIVERVYTTISHGRHNSTTTVYHVVYHYPVGPATVTARTTIARESYRILEPGSVLAILYLPAQIGNNRIILPAEERSVRFATWGLSLAALTVAIGGAFICRYYVRQNRLYRFLLAGGVACQGSVDSVPYDLIGKARTARFYLTFTFTDSQGRSRSGKSWYLRLGDETRWHTGSPVQVYFDPANSERFTVKLGARLS